MDELGMEIDFKWQSKELPPPGSNSASGTPLRDTLMLFKENFANLFLEPAACRNWNSMLVRKKYYRGTVLSKDLVSCLCACSVHTELNDKFEEINGQRDRQQPSTFYVLDWKDELSANMPVHFISFPNPVISTKWRKELVSHIIKIVCNPNEKIEESVTPASWRPWSWKPAEILPTKIESSPFLLETDPRTTPPPFTMVATPSPVAQCARWEKEMQMPTPWKVVPRVQPSWSAEDHSQDCRKVDSRKFEHILDQDDKGVDSRVRFAPSPKCSPRDLNDGFNDLMQWSDAADPKIGEEWFAALPKQRPRKTSETRSNKSTRATQSCYSVPEDREVTSPPFDLCSAFSREAEYIGSEYIPQRSSVPQSPFAVYFGD